MTEERRAARQEKLKQLREKKKARQGNAKATDDVDMKESSPSKDDAMKRRLYQTDE